MSWSFGTVPGGRVGNDVAFATVAGHTFAWAGLTGGGTGGILNLRVALRGVTLADLARTLGRLSGVRVTTGPAMSGGAGCYVVHCAGFKMVLSSPEPGSDAAAGLVSRTAPPTTPATGELSTALDGLMRTAPLKTQAAAPAKNQSAEAAAEGPMAGAPTSTLRRAPLRPGKTLTRKVPLARRTPLRRGPKPD